MSNFTLIAKNVTHIYEYIKAEYSDKYTNEDELLVITGMIDAWRYLVNRQLRIRDIVDAAILSRYNTIRLIPHSIDIYDILEEHGEDRLLNFTLNLEARLFSVDARIVRLDDILWALRKKRDVILKTIQKTKKKAKKQIPNIIKKQVDVQIHSIDIGEIKLIISENDPNNSSLN